MDETIGGVPTSTAEQVLQPSVFYNIGILFGRILKKLLVIVITGVADLAILGLIFTLLSSSVGLGFVAGKYLVTWLALLLFVAGTVGGLVLVTIVTDQQEEWQGIACLIGGLMLFMFAGATLLVTIT